MIVREIDVSDAEAAARLSGELGYPSSVSEMEERIRSLADLRDRIIYIAAEGDTVIAWIDVGVVHHLQTEPYAEIGGLVVSSECRSMGVGAQLVKEAEEWAKNRGLQKGGCAVADCTRGGSPFLSATRIRANQDVRSFF